MDDVSNTNGRRVSLLGPQRHTPTVAGVLAELGIEGPYATVTAGWEEREGEDAELAEHLGTTAHNLGLFPRAEEVFREDPEVRALLDERFDRLRELQGLYRMRLAPQLETCRQLLARAVPESEGELIDDEVEDAIAGVRALDERHLAKVADLDAEVAERIDAPSRPSLARHRDELGSLLAGTRATLVAGGHVGVLLNRLRLFDVPALIGDQPLLAWSGGAMVLSRRIVLFHDSPPQGPGDAEVYGPGLGLAAGVVPLPHARHRLRLDDPARVALLTRRFAPDLCVALDGGERLDGVEGSASWTVGEGGRVLATDGSVREEVAA